MSEELMPWHKTWLVGIDYNRVDLVKEGANTGAQIKLFKSKGGTSMDLQEILKGLKPEHASVIQKALDDAAAAVTAADAKATEAIEKSKTQEPTPAAGTSEEEILKSVKDPAVKALLETQIAKTKAAEAVAKGLKDEQDTAEAIAKAKEVPNLGADEAKMAEVYKQLKGTNPSLCEDVFGIFKAASALVKEGGVFTEVGKSAGNTDDATVGNEGDAWAMIEKAAEVIEKSSNISKAASISKAIQENPELYKTYLKAQGE